MLPRPPYAYELFMRALLYLCAALTPLLLLLGQPPLAACAARPAENGLHVLSLAGAHAREQRVVREVFLPWAARIKQRTAGKVEILYFAPGELGAGRDNFELTRRGSADLGQDGFSRHAERFPVSAVVNMSEQPAPPQELSLALWRMAGDIPELGREYAGVKLLALYASAPARFCWAVEGEGRGPGRLQGGRLLVENGEEARLARALGGNPQVAPSRDFSLYLARGLANGCVLPLETLRELKAAESIKQVMPAGTPAPGWWLGMNLEKWNALPQEYQRIIEEESGEKLSYLAGLSFYEGERQEELRLEAEGVVVLRPTADERAEWMSAVAASRAYRLRKAEALGLPARRIWEDSLRLRREAAGRGLLDYSF